MVVLGEGAVSYERGTPVESTSLRFSLMPGNMCVFTFCAEDRMYITRFGENETLLNL